MQLSKLVPNKKSSILKIFCNFCQNLLVIPCRKTIKCKQNMPSVAANQLGQLHCSLIFKTIVRNMSQAVFKRVSRYQKGWPKVSLIFKILQTSVYRVKKIKTKSESITKQKVRQATCQTTSFQMFTNFF